jgi:hypothetical protein
VTALGYNNVVAKVQARATSAGESDLIKLQVMHNGYPITAIIDTGSQLNVIRESIAHQAIPMPIDLSRPTTMNDANGGASVLPGYLAGVELTCGEVNTTGDLYVARDVPFDLLLGRPWQSNNYVSIVERQSGTYLEFRAHHECG